MITYWTPTTKAELIVWFKRNRPGWKLSKKSKKELYAIFFSIREGR